MINTEQYKVQLESDLKTIHQDLTGIATQNQATGDWESTPNSSSAFETDENSEADAFEESDERQATLVSLETTYRNTLRALEKIAAGNFGTCEVCEGEIETARLDFLPTARTCAEHLDEEGDLPI